MLIPMSMTLKYSGRWLRSRKSCRPAFESWRSRSRFNSISMPVEEHVGWYCVGWVGGPLGGWVLLSDKWLGVIS